MDNLNLEQGEERGNPSLPMTTEEAHVDNVFMLDQTDNEESSPSEEDTDMESSDGEGSSHYGVIVPSSAATKMRTQKRKKMFRRWRKGKSRKALFEFKSKLEDALTNDNLFNKEEENIVQNHKDIALWGVPLLPSKAHEGTDIILLKFLKAQGYRVDEAFQALKETLIWRVKENIDEIIEESLGDEDELNKVVYIDSSDKEGHPICFNYYGAFKNKSLYKKSFGSEKNRKEFLRWRVQFMEKSIKKFLSFKIGGVDSFLLISDMKNAPGPANSIKDLGPISKDAVSIFQQYYPELIYKHIVVNAPFWYYMYHGLVTQYLTNGTRKKFVFSRPHKVTETLLKYIPPENIPIHYGGLRRENDDEFTPEDTIIEFDIRPGALSTFELPISEVYVTMVWDVMVVGWDVTYKDEFIPEDEGSYKILLFKEKKVEESVRNSYYINEPGKILITVKNVTYIKKRVFIRHKKKVTLPAYMSPVNKRI